MVELFKTHSDPVLGDKIYPAPSHWSLMSGGLLISALRKSAAPMSIYVHIPFVSASYIEYLIAEMDLMDVAHHRSVVQIHWGGPAASHLNAKHVDDLMNAILARFSVAAGCDVGIDVGMEFAQRTGTDLIGFGVSAISHVGNTLTQNYQQLAAYEDAIGSGRLPVSRGYVRSKDDAISGAILEGCFCKGTISKDDIERRFHIDFDDYFRNELARLELLEHDGLIEGCGSRTIRIMSAGRIFIRSTVTIFDAFESAAMTAKASRAM